MKSDAIAFGVAGIVFGLIAGWIIGSQQGRGAASATTQAAPAATAVEVASLGIRGFIARTYALAGGPSTKKCKQFVG